MRKKVLRRNYENYAYADVIDDLPEELFEKPEDDSSAYDEVYNVIMSFFSLHPGLLFSIICALIEMLANCCDVEPVRLAGLIFETMNDVNHVPLCGREQDEN